MPTDPNYVPNPQAARVLSQLIELGHLPQYPPEMNAAWRAAFDAVSRFRTQPRHARWQEFIHALNPKHHALQMIEEVNQFYTGVEDRSVKSRIFYRAKDAIAPPPPLVWLVSDLITASSVNLLVGDAGSKKTLLSIDLAVSIALGKPWLGFPVVQGHALYVDEEAGLNRFWGLLHASLNAHAAPDSTPLDFVSLGGYDLRSEGDAEALTNRAISLNSRLIVIDALADITRGGDENSVAGVQPVLFHLRRMAEFCQAAVIVIHHNNRTGAFRGSSAIAASVDLMLAVRSTANDPFIDLHAVKARHSVAPPFRVESHFENSSDGVPRKVWFTRSNQKPATRKKISQPNTATSVLTFLAENHEATTDQFVSGLNIPLGTVRNVIQQLKIANLLERTEKDVGIGKSRRAVYRLSTHGKQLFISPDALTINENMGPQNDDDDEL